LRWYGEGKGGTRLPPNSEEGQGGKEEKGGPDESDVDKNAECPTNGREHLSGGSKKGGRSLQYRAHKACFGLTRMHEGLLSFFAQPQAVGVLGRSGCEATRMRRTVPHMCTRCTRFRKANATFVMRRNKMRESGLFLWHRSCTCFLWCVMRGG